MTYFKATRLFQQNKLTADLRCRCTPTKMGRDPERLLS
jgi:hypothetical protein